MRGRGAGRGIWGAASSSGDPWGAVVRSPAPRTPGPGRCSSGSPHTTAGSTAGSAPAGGVSRVRSGRSAPQGSLTLQSKGPRRGWPWRQSPDPPGPALRPSLSRFSRGRGGESLDRLPARTAYPRARTGRAGRGPAAAETRSTCGRGEDPGGLSWRLRCASKGWIRAGVLRGRPPPSSTAGSPTPAPGTELRCWFGDPRPATSEVSCSVLLRLFPVKSPSKFPVSKRLRIMTKAKDELRLLACSSQAATSAPSRVGYTRARDLRSGAQRGGARSPPRSAAPLCADDSPGTSTGPPSSRGPLRAVRLLTATS